VSQPAVAAADSAPRNCLRVAGHDLQLFEESPPLIGSMVRDIRAARRRVWLEAYIVSGDRAGQAIAAALEERAGAGVDVRLIYDAVGSLSTPTEYFADLEHAGVKVHCYHSLGSTFWTGRFFQLFNRRDHRKLLIADDVAYFGGMNIVDQSSIRSVDDAKALRLPSSAGWRDVHARMTGPKVAEVAATYDRLWKRVHHQPASRPPRWPGPRFVEAKEDTILFFESRPWIKAHRPYRVFVPLLRSARKSVTVSMAYFLPLGKVLRELVRAARRGVQVRVIVPARGDVKAAEVATRHMYEYLIERGIEIYERQDQMLHSKVMVVDGQWTVIGSCNLDPRSLWINLEFMGVFRSEELAAAVDSICAHELSNSRRITLEDYQNRGWFDRWYGLLAWQFRRFL
jgi:cardiolipin synthase